MSFITCLFLSFISRAQTCTDFLIQSVDKTWVNGRSMEFGAQTAAVIAIHARGEKQQSLCPCGLKGMGWESRYGYLAINYAGTDSALDGVNEKGLSMGFLWLPTAEYEQVAQEKMAFSLCIEDVGNWILGNFATVAEVKAALPNVVIWGGFLPQLKMVPPLHISIHDAQGNSLVVEFVKGEKRIYDNPAHVLTNYPTFDWQLTNLANYLNLSALNASPLTINSLTLDPHGQGSGMKGLPGDWLPSSRFVKAFFMKQFAVPCKTAAEEVTLAFHLLNSVDIPLGVVRAKAEDSAGFYELTQWVVVKDLTNKTLYFRSYANQNIYKIDLSKFDLSSGKSYKKQSIDIPGQAVDITQQLMP